MNIKEKLFRNTALVFIAIIILFPSCKKENPISGFYASPEEYYAMIQDSTLYLIYNPDTAIVYQLNTFEIIDSEILGVDINMRGYHMNFKDDLTMQEGFYSGPFECPFPFKYDSAHSAYGGTLMAWFLSETMNINGITFEKAEDRLSQKIYTQWKNLVFNNEISLDKRMLRQY